MFKFNVFARVPLFSWDEIVEKFMFGLCRNDESQIYSFETGLHASALMTLAIPNYVPWFLGSI